MARETRSITKRWSCKNSSSRNELVHCGSSVPACSATMYWAYQSGQLGSALPMRFSCSPCAAAARSFDVGDDQVESVGRAWCGGRDLCAELDRAPRTGRRELDDSEAVIEREVGIEPPPELVVELFCAVDIGDGDNNCLESHVDFRSAGRALTTIFVRVHVHLSIEGRFQSCSPHVCA